MNINIFKKRKSAKKQQAKDDLDQYLQKLPGKEVNPQYYNWLIALFAILSGCIIFVLVSSPLRITIIPQPDKVSIRGLLPLVKLSDRYLAFPGKYRIKAKKKGCKDLEELFVVRLGSNYSYDYKLQKLPGSLSVGSKPVSDAEVQIDGKTIGSTPISLFELAAGSHEIKVEAERYIPDIQSIEIQGMGIEQSFEVTLEPGWGTLSVNSDPQGSQVKLNGAIVGETPLETKPMAGKYKIELFKDGWQSVSQRVTIEPGQIIELPLIEMQKMDGLIKLTSDPSGARIVLNNEFRGVTPKSIVVTSERNYELSLSKSGFKTASQTIQVEQDESRKIDIQMEPEYGIVFIISKPADALLKVDNEIIDGFASQRLSLTTLPHEIEISKSGYETKSITVTPTVGISKTVKVELKTKRQIIQEQAQQEIKTVEGQNMRRIAIIDPVRIKMGASRRESGRRSNETQYTVELSRIFDISTKEVTNAEFRKFKRGHSSGYHNGTSLREADQPVVSSTWEEAAEYLNWLSKKEGLPLAYEEKNGKMVAVKPMTTGYRLPTEAEWVFVARYEGGNLGYEKPLKFPWGTERKIPTDVGNFADSHLYGTLSVINEEYKDGYEVSAPVGSFKANGIGIFDLGGNVSEWCHDHYDVHLSGQLLHDPMGPEQGEFHVVRGSSWHHGSVTELRLSYRDYSKEPRNDLGFRIARYVETE